MRRRNNSRLAKECRRQIDAARYRAKQERRKYYFDIENFYLGKAEAYQEVLTYIGATQEVSEP